MEISDSFKPIQVIDTKKKKGDFPGTKKRGEPYYCRKCERAWQGCGVTREYLMGFPTIGCTRKTCQLCKIK